MSTARFDEFDTVDWLDDAARERRTRARRRAEQLRETGESWAVVLVVGVLIGVNTALISIATEWLSDLKLGVCRGRWWLNEKFCCWEEPGGCDAWHSWDRALAGSDVYVLRWLVFVLLGTLMAAVCAFLVRAYAPLAAGSGLPEIKAILGGFVIRGFMGGWTLVLKSLGLALAVGSGLSVGKEGPAVHMGCCVGNVVSRGFRRFRRSAARQREIVSASAAAGVAVAFGAPIGGVLFSLEDLSSRFPRQTLWRSFFCALIATVSLQAMDPFWTGKLVMFQATYDRDWHFFELLFFVFLGVFGGIYGGVCIRLNLRVAKFRKRYLAQWPVAEAAVLALGTAAVTYPNVFTREDMGEMLGYLLQECRTGSTDGGWHGICDPARALRVAWGLLWAVLIRMGGTVAAYGARVPCGIFVPSMAIGASFGRMVGTVVQHVHQAHPDWRLFAQCAPDTVCVTPATYAFLGAAAAMCGVTKVTVAVVVIMYELTGALNFIVPTVVVVMVARIVGDMVVEGGISEQLILLNGVPFLEGPGGGEDLPIAALMRLSDDAHVLPVAGVPLERLVELLAVNVRGFPVVDNEQDMRLVGYVARDAVLRALAANGVYIGGEVADHQISVVFGGSSPAAAHTLSLAELVNTSPVAVRPHSSVATVVEIFRKLGPRTVLVTSADDGRLLGLLTRKDVLRHIRHHEH